MPLPHQTGISPALNPSKILLVRIDAIGDNVLFSAMLPHIAARFPAARLTIVCRDLVAPLFEHCPFIERVIPFNYSRVYKSSIDRQQLFQQLQQLNPDLCLNTMFSRERLADDLSLNCGAPLSVAFQRNSDALGPQGLAANSRYSWLVESPGPWRPELERHADFLKALGCPSVPLSPQVWASSDDRRAANDLFTRHGLEPGRTIALFAGAQFDVRIYRGFGKALSSLCREGSYQVVALGAQGDARLNQQCLNDIDAQTVNLSGETTVRQTAEIIRLCRLAVGTETGLAHLACAVGTRNVILLGGGHFGRFVPYSPLTSTVSLPLACFGCNWNCRYLWPHCVKDVAPEVLELAVREALAEPAAQTRVYFQDQSLWPTLPGAPAWMPRQDLLTPQDFQYTLVGAAGSQLDAGSQRDIKFAAVTRRFHERLFLRWVSGCVKFVARTVVRRLRRRLLGLRVRKTA
jgi:ADP-heptose:LPS heptosyltransferase